MAPFSEMAPGWSRFGSTFFLSDIQIDPKIHLDCGTTDFLDPSIQAFSEAVDLSCSGITLFPGAVLLY